MEGRKEQCKAEADNMYMKSQSTYKIKKTIRHSQRKSRIFSVI